LLRISTRMGHLSFVAASFHRRLPHWYRAGAAYFLTWRLAGSLPASAIADRITRSGARFVTADRLLDVAATGPRWLTEASIAESVIAILLRGEREGDYELGPWVLMPNHIHLVLRPEGELGKIMAMLKARTARQANRCLDREGQSFWSRDYFDRWIRNGIEEERIGHYIEQNPVKAGLCITPEQWQWSSAAGNAARAACPTNPMHTKSRSFVTQ
jgi:putative transposase